MTPEEHVAAIEKAHREHDERMRGIMEWHAQFLKDAIAPLPVPQVVVQDQKEAERSAVRRRFMESCAALEALDHIRSITGGDREADTRADEEEARFLRLRRRLLELDGQP